jgi:hypothetical protein
MCADEAPFSHYISSSQLNAAAPNHCTIVDRKKEANSLFQKTCEIKLNSPELVATEAVECLKAGACDLLFLPFDARAANVGDVSPPIFQFDYTLLVPAGSSIRSVADADRLGVRIAACHSD